MQLSDAQKKKIVAMKKRWLAAGDEAKAENLQTGARKREARDAILEEAEKNGIPRKAWKAEMRRVEHQRNADGVRDELDDQELLNHFDRLSIALELPGFENLTLAAEEEQEEKKAKRSRKKKAEAEEPAPDEDDDAHNDNEMQEAA